MSRLTTLAERDPSIFLITADLGFGVLTRFAERFPDQYLNVGVAEQNMTGLATGMALEGRIVYTYSIANFSTLRCLEQIRNDACYHDANVKVVAIGGGFSYGSLGISHHATEDLAILRALPGMTVVSPCDLWEASEATEAIAYRPGVCYLRLDKSFAPSIPRDNERFALDKARVLEEGEDICIMATGGIMEEVLKAARALREDGVRCRVLSMHTVKPIDRDAILSACRDTSGVITVEEHTVDGGLGGAVAEVCLDSGIYPKKFIRMGLRAGFSSIVGSQSYLRRRYGLGSDAIVVAAKGIVDNRPVTTIASNEGNRCHD